MKNAFKLFAVAAIIFLVFLPSYSRIQELKRRNSEFETKIDRLAVKNKELINERKLLVNDPVYLEKVAREKMGVAREGEVIFRLKPATHDEVKTVAGFAVE